MEQNHGEQKTAATTSKSVSDSGEYGEEGENQSQSQNLNQDHNRRIRIRDLGLSIGHHRPGRYNAITDVRGVKVGHSTIIKGHGELIPTKGPIRTGVTAIIPYENNIYWDRVVGGAFVLNGAGELSGITQVAEWGVIETPIILTNTLSVGTCSDAVVQYMTEKNPEIGQKHDVIIPLVGECDDSWLNDIAGQHVQSEHVYQAIANARGGPVQEGNVGGGTGMITCDFKAGIGTSSRKLHQKYGGHTVGVLVMSNFGEMKDLRIDGIPVGHMLYSRYAHLKKRNTIYGSIIAVVATDAPLLGHQLNRLAKRAALGIGRMGSYAAHGSGEIVLAFSTANRVPRETRKMVYKMKILLDQRMDPLYQAVVEATEEAIVNSLCMATDLEGINGNFAPSIPLKSLKKIIYNHKKFCESC
ncbi:MAG: P1 family peptidase [Oligoflexia bacterium]|nr:P1 family peptidase [Oligoflexia bacterium]MBF0365181.1 P1 family peptidase [Oligoflexia bacterium]